MSAITSAAAAASGTCAHGPRLVLQPGVKTPSCVAFSVRARCVPPELLEQALAISELDPSARAAAVLELLEGCEAVPSWHEPRPVRVRHRRLQLLHELSDGRVLCAVHPTGVATTSKRGGKRGKRPLPPPPAPVAALFPGHDSLLSPPALHALRGRGPRGELRATYKWNGENWLMKCHVDSGSCGGGGGADATAPARFDLYRRCDRKPNPLAQELRNNLTKLLAPKCFVRATDPAIKQGVAPLVEVGGVCRLCGALGGGDLAAHIAHDAVVAAKTGEFARFVNAFSQDGDAAGCGASVEPADARALPFLTSPFNQSVFWFRRVAKADGRKRRGKGSKKKGADGTVPSATASPPRERVVGAAVAEVWDYLARCAVSDAGQVCLALDSSDFLPPDGVNWEPCHDHPDPVTQHWPGYALMGTLERRPGCLAERATDPFSAAVDIASGTAAAKVARCAGAAATSPTGAATASLVAMAASEWQLRLVVSRLRLPKRTEGDRWAKMTQLRSTVWRAGVGDVPTEWRALRGDTTSGARDRGPGDRKRVAGAVETGEVGALCPSGFLIAAHEVARFKLASDVPPQAVSAMRAVGAAWRWYMQQVRVLGHAVGWDDADNAAVWEHSFEMVGADYQNNQEGLPKGVDMLVPHGWHPAGPAWLHPALHAVGVCTEAPPLHVLRSFSYFDFQRLFEADAEGAVIKEGMVLHAPAAGDSAEAKAGDVEQAVEVEAMVVKVRRDDFLGDDAPDLRVMAMRHPVLVQAAFAAPATHAEST